MQRPQTSRLQFTHACLCLPSSRNWYRKRRWRSGAGKVTGCLAESNGMQSTASGLLGLRITLPAGCLPNWRSASASTILEGAFIEVLLPRKRWLCMSGVQICRRGHQQRLQAPVTRCRRIMKFLHRTASATANTMCSSAIDGRLANTWLGQYLSVCLSVSK